MLNISHLIILKITFLIFYIFLLSLKIYENNFYLFFKNNSILFLKTIFK